MFNHERQIVALKLTPGNVNDTTPVPDLTQDLTEKLFGDKGYVGKDLAQTLLRRGLALMTRVRRNMKRLPVSFLDKALLNGRNIVETMIGHIKEFSSLRLPKHRSVFNAFTHITAAAVAYQINCKSRHFTRRTVSDVTGRGRQGESFLCWSPTSSPASATPRFAALGLDLDEQQRAVQDMPSTFHCVLGGAADIDFGRRCLMGHIQIFAVRPEGADHQWRRVPPRELSIALVADERFGRVTDWIEAS